MCLDFARLVPYTVFTSSLHLFCRRSPEAGLSVAAHPSSRFTSRRREVVPAMNGGRKEKRSRERLEVWLSAGEQQVFGERASTENISPGGMRVQTARPWKPESRLRVKAMMGDLRATGRVVYCQFLAPNTFALGLELARTRDA